MLFLAGKQETAARRLVDVVLVPAITARHTNPAPTRGPVVRRDNAESDEFGARNALQSSGAGSEADYRESERIRVHELQCEE